MKVRMLDKDGVKQSRHINPENYDSEKMEVIQLNDHDRRRLDDSQ